MNTSELRRGDCLQLLADMPDDSVDIVVTSPPYNQLGKRIPRQGTGMHKTSKFIAKVGAIGYSDDMPEPEYQEWIRCVVRECLRVARGLVWVNHKTRYRDGVGIHPLSFLGEFPLYSEVIWNRKISMAMNAKRFSPAHEYVFGFGEPHYWDDASNRLMSVWSIMPETGKTEHPCPFPEQLVARLIHASCPVNGAVLDPFAGSGTVAAVAVKLGRNAIGFDVNEAYLRGAERRVERAKIQAHFAELVHA
ncbi:MAG: site-specific DNA-methyltransferase [Chloroflexi bacterium]|nr:site-specific DNA-methyltransferase [Chloroflexota bacterium]